MKRVTTGLRLARPGIGLLALSWLVLTAPAAPAQKPKPRVPFEGSQAFRHVLNLFKVQPLRQVADLHSVKPADTLLIVFGDTAVLDEVARTTGGLEQFYKAGGAILLATDRPDQGRLQDFFKVRLDGKYQEAGDYAYHDLPNSPLIPISYLAAEHPLFSGLKKGIATNNPCNLGVLPGCPYQLLARLPPYRKEQAANPSYSAYIIGTGGTAGPNERLLILGGHGVFINGMMAQPDNDNFAFACNCVRWLTDGGKREHVLLVEEGKVQSDFKVPLAELPPLPVPGVEIVNKLLRGLEEENAFNRLLFDEVGRGRILQGLLFAVSLGLLVFGLRRVLASRFRIEPALPLVARSVAAVASGTSVLARRQEALLRGGNLWEAARGLAQHFFETEAPAWVERRHAPPVVVSGGWWLRWQLRRQIGRLWELAYGPTLPVSRRQFAHLQSMLASVQTALAKGTLRLPEPAAETSSPGERGT